MRIRTAEIKADLDRFLSVFPEELKTVEYVRDFLDVAREPCTFSAYDQGHITASGCVLSMDGQHVLLIHHDSYDSWQVPGGHVDVSDRRLIKTVKRELFEDVGLSDFVFFRLDTGDEIPIPYQIMVHDVPATTLHPQHQHIDFRYLATAPLNEDIDRGVSVKDVRWFSREEYLELEMKFNAKESVERAFRLFDEQLQ